VDVTACGCGINSALCFILMESDGSQASFGYMGVTYGTGYCDDSQPAELDIWEANSLTNVYTTHSCLNGQCDPYGGAFNTYALVQERRPLPTNGRSWALLRRQCRLHRWIPKSSLLYFCCT
jgi:hypothetical protein